MQRNQANTYSLQKSLNFNLSKNLQQTLEIDKLYEDTDGEYKNIKKTNIVNKKIKKIGVN